MIADHTHAWREVDAYYLARIADHVMTGDFDAARSTAVSFAVTRDKLVTPDETHALARVERERMHAF